MSGLILEKDNEAYYGAISNALSEINKRNLNLNVIWEPQPKQKLFMERPEYEGIFGGQAGGGKTDTIIAEALRQVDIPHYRAIIFRRTYPELEHVMSRSIEIYKPAYPKARFNESKHFWTFPSGAHIFFGSMPHEKNKYEYQGDPYDFVGFEEAGHFTWGQYSYMFSRNRPNGPGTRVYRRASCNPGGVGNAWIKSRFIHAAPPYTPIKGEYEVVSPDGKVIKLVRHRIFIPSSVFDNQKLLNNDPMYLANLAMLPKKERDALLYGSWDSFEGQVFSEFVDNPEHYQDRRWTHVIDPLITIPRTWPIYRVFDHGYAKPFSVGWWTFDEDGRAYRFKEYYGCTGDPDVGLELNPYEIAKEIRKLEEDDPLLKNRMRDIQGVADPAIFNRDRGPSVADMMLSHPFYLTFRQADNARLPGKMQLHYRFAFDSNGYPMIYVTSDCQNFIRTIPNLVYSQTHPEDVDTKLEDHIYDETRYAIQEMPIAPRENVLQKPPPDDPLNMYRDRLKFENKGRRYA